jgi:hypothetical protein
MEVTNVAQTKIYLTWNSAKQNLCSDPDSDIQTSGFI